MTSAHDADTVDLAWPAARPGTDRPVPFSSLVQVDLAGLSDRGKVRPNNEDHFIFARFGRYLDCLGTNLPEGTVPEHFAEIGYGMVVADGVGGGPRGELASRLALRTLVNLFLQFPEWILRLEDQAHIDEVMRRMEARIDQIQSVMEEQAQADPGLEGFGTTMTIALSLGKDLVITHVGDSRAYLFRGDLLSQLTRDHTRAQALVDAGTISREEAGSHRGRHLLTRSLGARALHVAADIHAVALEDGDCVLLCTDGLTDMVPAERITALLRAGQPAAATCRALVDEALNAGGKDNVTVVVARYRLPATS
jgi:serine/threonine protein phosphatase PrpC